MSAPVDVLAVMDEAAMRIENLREVAGFGQSELPPKVREARAAVAALIAFKAATLEALAGHPLQLHQIEQAALARVQGGAA